MKQIFLTDMLSLIKTLTSAVAKISQQQMQLSIDVKNAIKELRGANNSPTWQGTYRCQNRTELMELNNRLLEEKDLYYALVRFSDFVSN